MVTMGRVAGSWGLQGWLKVTPYSAERDALLDYRTWWLRSGDTAPWRAQAVSAARVHGAGLVAQFEGLVVPEEAQKLRGASIGIPRAQLPALAEGEIYLSDLPGLAVVNRAGVALGTVESVLEYGAHPVLRVVAADGGVRLIPFVGAHVDHVDVAARSVLVDWEEDY
jgi:16S rRNA processing protein RimM